MGKDYRLDSAYSSLYELSERLGLDIDSIKDIYIEINESLYIQFEGSLLKLELIRRFMEKIFSSLFSLPDQEVFNLCFAVNEICTNIIIHSYRNDTGKIALNFIKEGNCFTVRIEDSGEYGKSFNPDIFTKFNSEKAVSNGQTSGFGVLLVNKMMDSVEYKTIEGTGLNIFSMTKKIDGK